MGAVIADHAPIERGPLLQIEDREVVMVLGVAHATTVAWNREVCATPPVVHGLRAA
jgi:hypothetical protein